MKPELKMLFLMLADGVELRKDGATLFFSDPEIVVRYNGERNDLYRGGDLEEALAIFNAPNNAYN